MTDANQAACCSNGEMFGSIVASLVVVGIVGNHQDITEVRQAGEVRCATACKRLTKRITARGRDCCNTQFTHSLHT